MKKSRFTEQQILDILQEAQKGETSVAELCRQHSIHQATFYGWKQKYTGTTTPDQKRLKELEKENEKLLKMVGKLQMENEAMKTVIRKKY